MAPEFVDRIRGSRWVQAQPARPIIRREFCGFEEPSRSNLWRLGSCAIRRQQVEPGTARRANFGGGLGERSALPTGSKWVQAQPILPRLSQSSRATNVRKKSLFSS